MIGRGRDIEEFEYAVKFNHETCKWEILGDPAEAAASIERRKILDALKAAREPLGPKEIRLMTGLGEDTVSSMLWRLIQAGLVEKAGRGKYQLASKARPKDDNGDPLF